MRDPQQQLAHGGRPLACVRAAASRHFLAPGHPVDLAVFRILVFGVLLASPDVHGAAAFASLPDSLRLSSGASGWLAALPMGPETASVAYAVLVASSALALVGLWTRVAASAALASGLVLLGLPQLFGTVRHYHHLLWFVALLAASPCGDALSLDRLLGVVRGRAPARSSPSPAYGLPLQLAWVLVGLVYFFPGLWKWWTSGIGWALSDNLVHQMHWKWTQTGRLPRLRVDAWPWLCQAGALGVLLFEPAFLVLQFVRRLRPALIAAAVLFHLAARMFLYIPFESLWICYAGLLPWAPLLAGPEERLLRRFAGGPPVARRWVPAAVVGAALAAGVTFAGATRSVAAWPFACYPTFDVRVGPTMPSLEIEVLTADGPRRVPRRVRPPGLDGQRHWGLVWALVLERDPARREAGLRAYWDAATEPYPTLRRSPEVRFYRVAIHTDPARQGEVVQRRLLTTVHQTGAPPGGRHAGRASVERRGDEALP